MSAPRKATTSASLSLTCSRLAARRRILGLPMWTMAALVAERKAAKEEIKAEKLLKRAAKDEAQLKELQDAWDVANEK